MKLHQIDITLTVKISFRPSSALFKPIVDLGRNPQTLLDFIIKSFRNPQPTADPWRHARVQLDMHPIYRDDSVSDCCCVCERWNWDSSPHCPYNSGENFGLRCDMFDPAPELIYPATSADAGN